MGRGSRGADAAPRTGAARRGAGYEGTLATIDTDNSNIALQAVRSLGTEGRRKDGPQIPASDEIYDYIVFRGSDIQDLEVISGGAEAQTAAPAAAPAPKAVPQVPQAAPVPQAVPAAVPQVAAPQARPNAWGNPNAPKAAPAGGAKKPGQAASMAVAGLGPKGAKSSKGGATGGQPAAVKAPAAAPVKKPASFAAALGGGGAGPNGGGRAGAPGGPRGGQGGPRHPQQHQQQRHGGGYQGHRGQHGHQQYQQHMHPGANQGRHMAYPPRPAPVYVPTEDFDFSASTAKFEKITAEPLAQAEPVPAAYDKDDFFDCLSNEESTKMGKQRPNYSQMKRVDAETFGGVAAGPQGGQRGYGGNQRQGYGGGGGKRGGRGGGQQQRNANSRGSWKKVQH